MEEEREKERLHREAERQKAEELAAKRAEMEAERAAHNAQILAEALRAAEIKKQEIVNLVELAKADAEKISKQAL